MGKRWRASRRASNGVNGGHAGRQGNDNVRPTEGPEHHPTEISVQLRRDGTWRRATIKRIRSMTTSRRRPFDFYLLGMALAYEGCIHNDESLRNEGLEALEESITLAETQQVRSAGTARDLAGLAVQADAMMQLALLYNFSGLPSKGIHFARRATELFPKCSATWRYLANTLMQQGRNDEAIECLRTAIRCEDSSEADRRLLARFESSPEKGHGGCFLPFGMPEKLNQELDPSMQRDEMLYHLFCHRQFVRLYPEDSTIVENSCHLALRLGLFEEARRYAALLTGLQPDNADGWLLLGVVATNMGNITDAERAYRQVLTLRPDDEIAGVNLAKIHFDADAFLPGRIRVLQVLKVNPNNPDALSMYGNSLANYEQDYELSVEYHLRAKAAGQKQPAAIFSRLMALFQAGKVDLFVADRAESDGSLIVAAASDTIPKSTLELLRRADGLLRHRPATFKEGLSTVLYHIHSASVREFMTPAVAAIWLRHSWNLRHDLDTMTIEEQADGYEDFAYAAADAELPQLAIPALEKLCSMRAAQVYPVTQLALRLAELNQYEDGLKLLRKNIDFDPSVREALPYFLRAVGRHRDAFELLKTQIEGGTAAKSQIISGVEAAFACQEFDQADRWLCLASERFGNSDEIAEMQATRYIRSGNPQLAIKGIERHLSIDCSPHARLKVIPSESNPRDRPAIWLSLGFAAFAVHGETLVLDLFRILKSENASSPDWAVLQSIFSCNFTDSETILEELAPMLGLPHVIASRALLTVSLGRIDEARSLANSLLLKPEKTRIYRHPSGNPLALAYLVLSYCAGAEERYEEAFVHVENAIRIDCFCVGAHLHRVELLKSASRDTDAVDAMTDALRYLPGNADVLGQLIPEYLQRNDLDKATELLDRHRPLLVSQGGTEQSWFFDKLVTDAKLKSLAITPPTETLQSWTTTMSTSSQEWLRSAQLAIRWRDQLGISITIYLVKIIERELVDRIVEPFRQSLAPHLLTGEIRDLSEFVTSWERRHPPGLGAMARALRTAAKPVNAFECKLFQAWRKFLNALPEPIRSGIRGRKFLDELEAAARLRNSVAHIGGAPEREMHRLQLAVVDQGRPGILLQGLGITDQ